MVWGSLLFVFFFEVVEDKTLDIYDVGGGGLGVVGGVKRLFACLLCWVVICLCVFYIIIIIIGE